MRISHAAVRLVVLGTALSGLAHAGLILDRGLPNDSNINTATPRSNFAWLADTEATGNINGDSFQFKDGGTIDSITVWEVVNNPVGSGNPSDPASEFSSISLYLGADGSPLPFSSSSFSSALVTYQPGGEDYLGSDGVTHFSIYALTFSGLNFAVTAHTVYDFAVDAVGNPGGCANTTFGDPCILALHGSNAGLSGTPQQGSDGQFLVFTVSGGVASLVGPCDVGCQAGTIGTNPADDINVQIQGTLTPEPATLGTLAASLGGLILFARKRRK
jgi:hypothetical protein